MENRSAKRLGKILASKCCVDGVVEVYGAAGADLPEIDPSDLPSQAGLKVLIQFR